MSTSPTSTRCKGANSPPLHPHCKALPPTERAMFRFDEEPALLPPPDDEPTARARGRAVVRPRVAGRRRAVAPLRGAGAVKQ